MFALIFVILINVLRDLHNQLRKSRELKPKPLCTNCFYAHMQYGSKAERVISCTFGGSIRPVSLEVLYCTDYQERNSISRSSAIGFVREISISSMSIE